MKIILAKKNIILVFMYVIGAIILLLPLFHNGVPQTHDTEAHLVRIAAYQKAIQNGNFPVRWAQDLNYTFGSPLFIFYYPFPYYVGFMIHVLGFNLETTWLLLSGIAFLGSFFSFLSWAKLFADKKVAFLGALAYLLNPYHFLDLYVRGDVGELFAYALLPFVFYFITKNKINLSIYNTLFGGIIFALLLVSHNGISLIFFPVIGVYLFIAGKKNFQVFMYNGFLLIEGFLLSAFFWIPALYEKKYIATLTVFDDFYKNNFVQLHNIIYSPWGFGTEISKQGGLSGQIGILQTLVIFVSLVCLFCLKTKKYILFWFITSLVGIFLALPYSSFLYLHIKILRDFQFPWRFLVLVSFSSSALIISILKKIPPKYIYFFSAILFVYSLFFVKVQGYIHHPDSYYFNLQDITFYHGEAIPMWSDGNKTSFPKSPLELIAGQGTVTNFRKTGTIHSFTVTGLTETGFLDNTIYFPGWQVKVDGVRVPIQFQDAHHRGLITFNVPAGKHTVMVEFKESSIRLFSDILSFVTLVAVLGTLVLTRKYAR